MTRDDVIEHLRALRPELEAAGAKAVYLFGSFARDEADDNSDIDITIDVDHDRKPHFSILDMSRIRLLVQDTTGRWTDVGVRQNFRRIAQSFEHDAIKVF